MNKTLKLLLVIVLILVALAAGASAYYFYAKYQDLKKNPERIAQEETQVLVEKVGKLMELPNETPTIATVLDKSKLKDQPFFKNAENGDKVLVYIGAKKAILYRPSTDKIIEVAPLATENKQSSTTPVNARVVLLNGTNTQGLTNTAETKIKDKVAGIEITGKDNAQSKNYNKTVVVDLNGSYKTQADQIASLLGGEVGSWPEGETKPNADIVVIVAQ
jgi:uncharacterized protein YneF (UPF0154 family)